jgi:enolase
MKITKLSAREIYDSRGFPTVECELVLNGSMSVIASVPSGASVGSFEALELRDGGDRLDGKGVLQAVHNIGHRIAPVLVGEEIDAIRLDQRLLELDGTPNKSNLGANAMLAVSMALYKAHAVQEQADLFELIAWVFGHELVTLPVPFFNLINGGRHADNKLQIQEFMIVPLNAQSYRESVEAAMEFSYTLHDLLKKRGKRLYVGDEGGIATDFNDEIEALTCLSETLALMSSKSATMFAFALDIAATTFYDVRTNTYNWHGKSLSAHDLIAYYAKLAELFPLYSLEDGLAENDWEGWQQLYQLLGSKIQIVGDDLFATNTERIQQGIALSTTNGVIIKPNQIGTITQTLQAIKFCKDNKLNTIVSHRSGETEDTFIADLAVGVAAGQIKAGGCSRGERMAKYNRLLRIEDHLIAALLSR